MSSTTGFAPRSLSGTGFRAAAAALFARVWQGVRRWHRIASTRRDLADMDDRMLSDLGISRAQARFELSRTPWTQR